jgi:hypothetical protein
VARSTVEFGRERLGSVRGGVAKTPPPWPSNLSWKTTSEIPSARLAFSILLRHTSAETPLVVVGVGPLKGALIVALVGVRLSGVPSDVEDGLDLGVTLRLG